MTPTPSADEVFAAAQALTDPSARSAYLDRACARNARLRAEVESLLAAADRAATFLESPAPGVDEILREAQTAPERPLTEMAGSRIGRYRLLERIGEGGFGVVWMAEQEEPVRRRVALKIIKLGMDTREVVARFEAERQALALMDHPNIAKVLDGGATDTGRPYFVMDLVKGVPITRFCDERRLSTRQRLELFMQVCHAVQHAHQKGIIHRDLKPSNILVTEQDDCPLPKVIDFGVAKATQARLTEKTLFTRLQQWIGTPAYMSPEQAGLGSLDVDTRSDVYSLGVVLYELLTGRTPFDTQKLLATGYEAVMRTIREEDPPKPSTRLSTLAKEELSAVAAQRDAEPAKLGRLVRGDLDRIVMKALEKDRARRYETASALARDLEHYAKNEPVTAVPPSLLYLVGRFVRRRRTAVAVGAALSVLVLLTAGAIIRGAIRDHRHQAELQAERASAAQQAALAEQATAQVQATASELDEALSQRRLEEVTKLLERQLDGNVDVAQAAALLARTIRESPNDTRATYRLMALLSQRDFARPLAERVFDREVVGLAWTHHGLVAAVRDGNPQAIHRPVALVSFETGDVLLRPLGEERGFREFRFIAEGRLFWVTRLAPEGPQEQVWICDSATGKAVGPPISLPGRVHQVVPEATEQRVAVGVLTRAAVGYTPALHVYDLRSGQLIGKPLVYGSGGITARVRFETGGHRVLIPALVMQERSRLWNVENGNVTELPPGLPQLAVSDGVADEPQLGDTEQLRRPDWLPGSAITLPNAIRDVSRAAFAPDGQKLATLGADNRRVRLWDVTPTAMRSVEVFNPAGRDPQPPGSAPNIDAVGRRVLRSFGTNLVVVDKEGRWSVAPNTAGSTLVVWDLASGTQLPSWDLASPKAERVHLSPDGEWVLLVGAGQARLCAATDGRPRSAPFGLTGTQRVADGTFTPDGSRVLTWSEAGGGQVWRVEPWGAVGSFGQHGARAVSVSVSPDGRRAATVASDAKVRIWEIDTGKEVATPFEHPAPVNALDWAEAGEVLVTGAQDGNARVWDLRTGSLRGTPLRHGSPVTKIIVLDTSSHLVTVGEGQPAKLWNLRSGAFVRALQPGTGYYGPTEVHRTSGGTLLLVAGSESRVYDPTTWLPLSDRIPIDFHPLEAPAVSRNGAAIAAFLGPRMAALALPEVAGPAPVWLAELAEAVVGKRLTEQGAAVVCSFAESRQVFDRLRAIEGTDAYSRWLRWYLTVGPDRPLHPGTRVTQGDAVRRVTDSIEFPNLNWGLEFAPLHPVLLQARAEIASESLATTLARPAVPPADAARLRRYGIVGQEMTDFIADDGLQLAQQILRRVPESEAAWKLSALGYAVLRQTNAAVQALAQVRTAPNKGYDWFLRGYVLEAAGDAAGAERAYAEASALQPATFFRARPYDKAAVLRGAILPRDPAATAAQIDLTKFYHAGLGVACLGFDARNNLGNLPAGLQVFDRIRFDARGIVQLAREATAQAQGRQFPDHVRGIPLEQRARRLHFLHGTGWTIDDGVEVGRYVIHYANGTTEALPLLYGRDLRNWWDAGPSSPADNAVVAWTGPTPGGERVCIYHRVWENPFPDQAIASLDFLSTQTSCAPFLIAVTVEP